MVQKNKKFYIMDNEYKEISDEDILKDPDSYNLELGTDLKKVTKEMLSKKFEIKEIKRREKSNYIDITIGEKILAQSQILWDKGFLT